MSRAEKRASFDDAIHAYEAAHGALPGVQNAARRAVLVEQLVESERRNEYFARLREREIGESSCDPASVAFNPLKAAIRWDRQGNRDEAFWMVFLFVHFGKHRRSGWRLIADVYGRLGQGPPWSWEAVSADVPGFRKWLGDNVGVIRAQQPRRGFGNHRKYESLDAWSDRGTGAAVASYVEWVGPSGSHDERIVEVLAGSTGNAFDDFQSLYRSIRAVRRFGRTGAFDYCAAVSKLGLVPIAPGVAGLVGATGPLAGARLLVLGPGQVGRPGALEAVLAPLQAELGVGFDALEDALCNWQKNPDEFKPFRG